VLNTGSFMPFRRWPALRKVVDEILLTIGWQGRVIALKTVPQILELLWRAAPRIVAISIALRIAAALLPLMILEVTRQIIDIIAFARIHTSARPGHLWPWLILEFVLAAAALAFGRSIDYCEARIADEFTRAISLRVMKHTAEIDLASIEDPAFHDKLERARVQATDRISMLHAMGSLLQSSVVMISLGIGIMAYAPWLLALMVLCVLPAFAGESSMTFEGYSVMRALTPFRRELDYLRLLGSSRESAKEVKMFGLDEHLRRRYERLSEVVMQNTRALAWRRLKWGSLLGIIASLGYYGGYAFLAFEAFSGRITIGTLTFLVGAVAGANVQLQMIFGLFSSVSEQALFLTDLVDLLRVEPRICSKPNAVPVARPVSRGLEFYHVSFKYPGSDRLVLKDLSLSIRPGERVALVGENGQGKTTMVKLIARLYEPTEGTIFLDGIDIRDYRLDDLRREVGVIFQDFFRYDMPVRDNIGTGRVELIHDDAALWAAAERTGSDDMIERLPGGLDQMLGRRFDGGIELSGGQWQKIALARAYVRDAQILILDEPTASLDAAAEAEVFDNFAALTRGRMALLISHRFSTVRIADRIVVLEDGQILEAGTHDELMAAGGQYAQLFDLQAASYR
jgi:ATP-binding cassette subfamily B protein